MTGLLTYDPTYEAAACVGHRETFFLPDGARGAVKNARERAAKRICGRCPIRSQCLTDALVNNEEFGVFGGTTPEERTALMADGARR